MARDNILLEAQEAQQLAEAKLAEAAANAELHALESLTQPLQENSWESSDWNYVGGTGTNRRGMQGQQARRVFLSTISDRQDGRYLPYYETEYDLRRMWASSRNLAAFTSTALGAVESLVDYVIGTGFTFTANAEVEGADTIAGQVQAVIDQLVEDNDIIGVVDREIHDASRVDGEVFVALRSDGWRTKLQIILPEQVTEPGNPRPIEEWLGVGHKLNYWWYGIHTQYDQTFHTDDSTNPLGYHVVFDEGGSEWDYIPSSRMVHFKRNTPRVARRGVSDFMPVQADIEREAKLRKNTAEGAAVQAAIAFIREHPQGVSQSSIQSLVSGNAARTVQRETSGAGSKDVKVERFNGPTVKDIPAGMKYHAGPMGTLRSPVFIEVAQYIMRSIGVRWSMPEYIISGDASNANFASSLVSESPFVKSRENDQGFYKRHFKKLLWKAVRIAWEAGKFGGIEWSDLQSVVSIKIDAPEVASRDMFKQAQTSEIESRNGLLSKRTWAAEIGRDYDEERENIDNEPVVAPEQSPGGFGFESRDDRLHQAATLLWEGYP